MIYLTEVFRDVSPCFILLATSPSIWHITEYVCIMKGSDFMWDSLNINVVWEFVHWLIREHNQGSCEDYSSSSSLVCVTVRVTCWMKSASQLSHLSLKKQTEDQGPDIPVPWQRKILPLSKLVDPEKEKKSIKMYQIGIQNICNQSHKSPSHTQAMLHSKIHKCF